MPWGAAEGAPGMGSRSRDTQGHPPASHSPQAVIKGDTAGLRKDLQSPLNLQPSLK